MLAFCQYIKTCHPSNTHPPTHPSVRLSVCLSIYLSIYISEYLYIYLSPPEGGREFQCEDGYDLGPDRKVVKLRDKRSFVRFVGRPEMVAKLYVRVVVKWFSAVVKQRQVMGSYCEMRCVHLAVALWDESV